MVRNADLGDLKNSQFYLRAKSGSARCAIKLIEQKITDAFIQDVSSLAEGKDDVIILPVMAKEGMGNNKIPYASALFLSYFFDIRIDERIVQSSKAFRTGSGADHRLTVYPEFDGKPLKNHNYIIVDDTLAMGGTIATLRSYLMAKGANVIGAAVLTAHQGVTHLPIRDKMLNDIYRKHGDDAFTLWEEEFGYGIDCLTQGEAGHIKAARSVESLRDRITEARLRHLRSFDESEGGE